MKRILAVALSALLTACAATNLMLLKPGSVSIDGMRAKEPPTAEWKNPDGTLTLEYSRRAGSDNNIMLDFDAKGMLKETRLVNVESNFPLLKTGMTRADVQRIVGSPRRIHKEPLSGGEIWEIPTETGVNGFPVRVIHIYWHPRVDGAVKILLDHSFE